MNDEIQEAVGDVPAALGRCEVYSTLRLCTTTLPNNERWILEVSEEEAKAILTKLDPQYCSTVGILLVPHDGGTRICCHVGSFAYIEAVGMGLPYLSAILEAASEAGHHWVDLDSGAHHPYGIPHWIWSSGPAPQPGSEAAGSQAHSGAQLPRSSVDRTLP